MKYLEDLVHGVKSATLVYDGDTFGTKCLNFRDLK